MNLSPLAGPRARNMRRNRRGDAQITSFGDDRRPLTIRFRVRRRPSRDAIDIPVIHTEGCGDEHRVMDLEIRGTESASSLDVLRTHEFATLLDFARDLEQRFQLVRDGSVLEIALHVVHKLLVAAEVVRRNRAV